MRVGISAIGACVHSSKADTLFVRTMSFAYASEQSASRCCSMADYRRKYTTQSWYTLYGPSRLIDDIAR